MHEDNPGLKSVIDARLRTQDQLLLFDQIKITGIPVEPWTPYFKTNNFIQRSLAILLAYNSTKSEFQLVGVDNDNNLSVKGTLGSTDGTSTGTLKFLRVDSGGRLLISTEEDLKEDLVLLDNVTVEASGTATHVGIDVGMYLNISLMVETNRSMTVYMQGSTDNVNFYDVKTIADVDITHNCNNEKILISVPFFTRYFRVSILNSAGAQGTVTARLSCHA